MSNIDFTDWGPLLQECNLYGQGIINEISPETIEKLIETGSDLPSLTREEIRERFEFTRDWLSQEIDIGDYGYTDEWKD